MATTQPANASVDAIPPPSSLNQSSDSSPSSSNSSATTDPPKDSAPNQPSKLPAPPTSSNTSASLPPSSPPPSPPPASPPPVPISPPPPILSQSPPLEVANPKSSSPSPSIVVPSPLSPSEKTSPPSADTPLPPAKQLENSPPPSALTPPSLPVSSPSSLPPTGSLIPGPTTSPSNGSINYSAGGAPLSFNLSLPIGVPPGKPTSSGSSISANAAPAESGGIKAGTAVALGVALGFLGLGLVIVAVWFARKQKRRGADSLFLNGQYPAHPDRCTSGSDIKDSPISALGNSRSWFTYEELARATNGFSAENILGEGGFGCVYKGLLVDGKEVAVKQLKIGAGQGEREFRAEVEIISRIHHRHLVSLVGYCISENERLLVYDYVPNNTLDYHLHADGRPVIKWATRVKVAAGAGRGIAYLHEDCNPRIIHRDIKSSNILLDNNFTAQVADFGLAKLAADANSHVTTRVVGTFGYMAPEYASSGKLTEKSDVFSFGVVLLELITGRKPVDASQPEGAESLVEWARPLLTRALESERFQELIDPRLENNYVKDEMLTMIEAAAACTRHLASKRPQMSQLVRVLGSAGEPDLSNGIKPGHSIDLDSKEQYAEIRMFQRMAFGNQDFSLGLSDGSQSSGDCSK